MSPPKVVPRSRTRPSRDGGEPVNVANRYRICRKLGSGSFGTVFLVADIKYGNELKVLKEIPIGDIEPDETISAVNEARLLSKLEHPGIVKFHDSFIDGEYFCIITEYCEGGDLDDRLHSWKKNGKEVDSSLVMTWFIQMLLAVQYMHQRRVLHRDLKTRNIFLKNNMVKIGDFGISRILMGTTDIATTFTGTPYFMAPEILKHEGYNSKSDIWSIAVILYEMCTLKRAFQGNSLMSVMFKIVQGDVPSLPNSFGSELQDIYKRMLSKDPAWRLSASDILKNDYIQQHLKSLKIEIAGSSPLSHTTARKEAEAIAKVLNKPKKRRPHGGKESSRPLTPKEQLKLRKQKKADEEAERLKKEIVSTYTESRRKYSRLKDRQSRVAIPFLSNENNDDKSEKEELQNEAEESVDLHKANNIMIFRNDKYLADVESDRSLSVVHLNEETENKVGNIRKYTHCFGEDDTKLPEDIEKAKLKEEEYVRHYTHCFGDDEEEDVFLQDSLDFTNVSTIPEDAELADTYYTTCDDFEEDESSEEDRDPNSDSEEYDVLADYMQNALDLSGENAESTFGDTMSSLASSTTMRQQKIDSLRRECVRLLGEEGFRRAYRYLNKVRFESNTTVSEDVILYKLRKMIGNSRDCFLVDQLLFLEKQNQICNESLEFS